MSERVRTADDAARLADGAVRDVLELGGTTGLMLLV